MKRTRQVYCLLEPEIYEILKLEEENVSLYIHDVICVDLIKRGKLSTKRLVELRTDTESDTNTEDTPVHVLEE